MNERVTIYSYHLNDDVKEAEFVSCSDKVSQLMKGQAGFLYRSLGKTEDDVWVDVNYWSDEADSAALDALFEKDVDCQRFMAMINQQSLNMQRNNVVSTIYNAPADS